MIALGNLRFYLVALMQVSATRTLSGSGAGCRIQPRFQAGAAGLGILFMGENHSTPQYSDNTSELPDIVLIYGTIIDIYLGV